MNEWFILINLLIAVILGVCLPLIWMYYMLRKKRTPAWIMYGVLVSISAYLLDYVLREEKVNGWTILVLFVMLLFLVLEQRGYQKADAKQKEVE